MKCEINLNQITTIILLKSAAVSPLSSLDFDSLQLICPEPLLLFFQCMECISKVFSIFMTVSWKQK